eukprot:1593668-Pyramimonas_sp.AAC.1
MEASCGHLGFSSGHVGRHGGVIGPSWRPSEPSWRTPPLRREARLLEATLTVLEAILGPSGLLDHVFPQLLWTHLGEHL